MAAVPVVRPLPSNLGACTAFERLAHLPFCLFLDSSMEHDTLGRYSFVCADPYTTIVGRDGVECLAKLETLLPERVETLPDLPPFQGGVAGLFGYELGGAFERIDRAEHDEFRLPDIAIGLYDVVLAFDHRRQSGWLISQGFNDTREQLEDTANQRADQFMELLSSPTSYETVRSGRLGSGRLGWGGRIPRSELARQYPTDLSPDLTSDFSKDQYLQAVARAVEYVHAGDVFQVNLSQRLLHPLQSSPVDLYTKLRRCNPATFSGYFDFGSGQVLSASPERFLRIHDDTIESRPIKGTRGRIRKPEADLFTGDELLESQNDRAENIMILDLMRNDLSRVCSPDSIEVTQLCGIEKYQFVQHLVSAVEGKVLQWTTLSDLLKATFPGGSITGAPKVRAMEIIAELEPTVRGPYCGCLGYLGFDGTLDLNILIRTITASKGWCQISVGGGVVAKSKPLDEWEETWTKSRGLLEALK